MLDELIEKTTHPEESKSEGATLHGKNGPEKEKKERQGEEPGQRGQSGRRVTS